MPTREELLATPLGELSGYALQVFHGEIRGGGESVIMGIDTLLPNRYFPYTQKVDRSRWLLRDVLGKLKGGAAKKPPVKVLLIDCAGGGQAIEVWP